MLRRIASLALLGLMALQASAHAAGFHVREQGAKAMGMANAFVAVADDPSAIFYNPAGIAFQDSTRLSLGVTTILMPATEFSGDAFPTIPGGVGSERARSDIFFPPNAYWNSSRESLPLSFGLGINSQFPLAKRWDVNSNLRWAVREIAIKPLNVNPTVAWRFDELNLSLGGGINYTWTQVWREKTVRNGLDDGGQEELEGDGDGWGYNLGLLWKPNRFFAAAVAYRSEIELDVSGDLDYRANGALSAFPTFNADARTSITLPDSWSLGFALFPREDLTLSFEANRFGWSSYDRSDVFFSNFSDAGASSYPNSLTAKNWEDVWAFRFGLQYSLTRNLDLRLGYAYDNTPVPGATLAPDLPDADRHNYTVGVGYYRDNFAVDLAYMYVDFMDRTLVNAIQAGTYKNAAHLFGLNFTYHF